MDDRSLRFDDEASVILYNLDRTEAESFPCVTDKNIGKIHMEIMKNDQPNSLSEMRSHRALILFANVSQFELLEEG